MSFFKNFKKALVLCPHTDDEFGCAGTIIKMVNLNIKIKYIAFSSCEESVPDGFPKNILVEECKKVTSLLGIKKNQVDILKFRVRHFPSFRQDILEYLVEINKNYQPDLVLLPCSQDIHQDHNTIYNEGLRAFKYSTMLGYELPQNINTSLHTTFVSLNKQILNKKIEILSHYKTQNFRSYSSSDFIKGLAKVRGVQSNSKYAEAFETIRLIVK